MIQQGSKVFLKYTGKWAYVFQVDQLEPYVLVELTDSEQILVHRDDIYSEEEYAFMLLDGEADASEHSGEKKEEIFNTRDEGFYLVLATRDQRILPDDIQIWLINQTPYLCEFSANLFGNEGSLYQENGLLDAGMQHMLCEMYPEDLSLQPKCDLNLIFSNGTAAESHLIRHRFQVKKIINGKWDIQGDFRILQFSLLALKELFKVIVPEVKSIKKKQAAPRLKANVSIHSIERKAAFPLEKDLHAAALIPGYKSFSKQEILHRQLAAFEEYLHEAYRIGQDKIVLIHGIGEGKLKDRIHQRLDQIDWVKDFRNEYHPRYGWGATEVFL